MAFTSNINHSVNWPRMKWLFSWVRLQMPLNGFVPCYQYEHVVCAVLLSNLTGVWIYIVEVFNIILQEKKCTLTLVLAVPKQHPLIFSFVFHFQKLMSGVLLAPVLVDYLAQKQVLQNNSITTKTSNKFHKISISQTFCPLSVFTVSLSCSKVCEFSESSPSLSSPANSLKRSFSVC